MVGEIRDLETAEIAIQASLTGHLVLLPPCTPTTLPAPSPAWWTWAWSRSCGLFADGVLAQRLVRVLWQGLPRAVLAHAGGAEGDCLTPESVREASGGMLYKKSRPLRPNATDRLPRRSGIYEMMLIDDDLRQLTLKTSTAAPSGGRPSAAG